MNLRRGFFRAGVAISAAWIIFAAAAVVAGAVTDLVRALLLIVIPPVALFVVALLAVWIFRGFSGKQGANVTRGLFRVWAALSLFWIVGVSGPYYANQTNLFSNAVPKVAYYNVRSGGIAWQVEFGWSLDPSLSMTTWHSGDKRIAVTMNDGGQVIVAPIDPVAFQETNKAVLERVKVAYEQLVRMERERIPERRREVILVWVGVCMIPPMMLLILGSLVLWSVRGFRNGTP